MKRLWEKISNYKRDYGESTFVNKWKAIICRYGIRNIEFQVRSYTLKSLFVLARCWDYQIRKFKKVNNSKNVIKILTSILI